MAPVRAAVRGRSSDRCVSHLTLRASAPRARDRTDHVEEIHIVRSAEQAALHTASSSTPMYHRAMLAQSGRYGRVVTSASQLHYCSKLGEINQNVTAVTHS